MSSYNTWWGNLPSVTKNLVIINFICWLADTVLTNRFGIPVVNIFGLHYFTSPAFFFWQPFTYMFLHAGFEHIFFNMFALLMFAGPLEHRWGSHRFLIYYFVCGVGAGLVQELVWFLFYGSVASYALTIGASGAVFGILFAFGWLFPDVKMFMLFVPIPIPARIFVGIYALLELFLGVSRLSGDNVAHFAHLGGMLFGWLLLLWWRRNNGYLFSQTPYRSRFTEWIRNKLASLKRKKGDAASGYHYQDPVKNTSDKDAHEKEIDRILDKVRREGYGSLTQEEKEQLFKR